MAEQATTTQSKRPQPKLQGHALKLEYFTVGYNLLEGIGAVILGLLANSIALVGFGLDSGIEVLSALVLVWRLTRKEETNAQAQKLERRAVLFVGLSFVVLSLYIGWEAISKLVSGERPAASWGGVALSIASLVVMPLLAMRKKKVAAQIGSRALAADAVETFSCAWLAAVLLGGLILNSLFGWWWADPIASLGIALFLLREAWENIEVGTGREALNGGDDDDDD